jgi:hypothetical protein
MADPLPATAEIEILALAGCTEADTAVITSLSLDDVSDILDAFLRLANAKIAILRGEEKKIARHLRFANRAIPKLCEPIFTMLRLGVPDKLVPDTSGSGWINPGPHVEGKWRLIIGPCRSRRRPCRNSQHRSAAAVQSDCLDFLWRDPIAALRFIAELLDPPAGAEWRLVFKAGRREPPSTELKRQLRVAATVVEMNHSKSRTLEDAINVAKNRCGICRRTTFRNCKSGSGA